MDLLDRIIDLALEEDLGAAGDLTTRALVEPSRRGSAELLAKEPLVLAGSRAFDRAFARVDEEVSVRWTRADGDSISKGEKVARVEGSLASILTGERTALNLIQRCSGIATLAREAASAVRGTKLSILDTRKTSPGLRQLSKEAVRAGGAQNHRFGLFDGILIKDNHLAAVGGKVALAVKKAKAAAPLLVKVEVEITSLSMLDEAISAGADIVMLDNMDDAQIAKAVKRARGRVKLEVSGGITLERLPKLAALGVDYVSMGALTHSARAMDFSLEVAAKR